MRYLVLIGHDEKGGKALSEAQHQALITLIRTVSSGAAPQDTAQTYSRSSVASAKLAPMWSAPLG